MKNRLIVLLMILFGLASFIEGQDNEAGKEYKIYYENFISTNKKNNTNIIIKYPQIKGMNSKEKQNKINKLIKDKAIYTFYDDDKKIIEGLNLNVNTEITYFSEKIISIKYSTKYYYWKNMKTYESIYATNLDLINAELIDAKKIFNNNLKKILSRNLFTYKGPYKSKDLKNIETNTYEYGYVYGDDEIIVELFDRYYNELRDDRYYFDKDKFTLIVEIPSGPTSVIELCSDYNSIKSAFNLNYKIWNEFINKY